MSTIKCSNCGFENDVENNYCVECGNRLNNGLLSRMKKFFSSNKQEAYDEYKSNKFRFERFNKKYSTQSKLNDYIDSPEDILTKNKDIYEKLNDFKKLKLSTADYELLDTFQDIYENFDEIINHLNKKYIDEHLNFNKIRKFIDDFKINIDYSSFIKKEDILNVYSQEYELAKKIKDSNSDIQTFIEIYEDFDNISNQINNNHIKWLNQEFIKIKTEIVEFIECYSTNISYDKFISEIERDNILNNYSKHYGIVLDLIRHDDSCSDKKLINEFIETYKKFTYVVNLINEEFKKREDIKNNFIDVKAQITDFVNKYDKDISPDLYIDDYESILNDQKSNYNIALDYKKYFKDNNNLINSFVNLFKNFKDVSSNINKKFIDDKYNCYLESEDKIKGFIEKFSVNISRDVEIKEREKEKLLDDFKSDYDLCIFLKNHSTIKLRDFSDF